MLDEIDKNFNTSHVEVKPSEIITLSNASYFNTSHVEVKLKMKTERLQLRIFQYISC